jgi:hypothetical protein
MMILSPGSILITSLNMKPKDDFKPNELLRHGVYHVEIYLRRKLKKQINTLFRNQYQ